MPFQNTITLGSVSGNYNYEKTNDEINNKLSFLKVKNTLPYKIYAGSPAKEIGLSEINYREDKILELKKIL